MLVLSRIVVSSCSNCSLRCCDWCCSVMSRVTTDVVRFPDARVPARRGSAASAGRAPDGGSPRPTRLGAQRVAQRVLDLSNSGSDSARRCRADRLQARPTARSPLPRRALPRRRRNQPVDPGTSPADPGGVHHRADLHLSQVALLLPCCGPRRPPCSAAGRPASRSSGPPRAAARSEPSRWPDRPGSSVLAPGCSCASGRPR